MIRDEIGVMCRRMSRGGDRFDHGVAELDALTICELVVLELGPRSLGHVGHSPGPPDELRQTGDMVGLNVGLDHRGDLRPLGLRADDVLIDEIQVGVDDGELTNRLAAEQVGGAGRLVVEELAEVHLLLHRHPQEDRHQA
jgi:hypothetical protein